MSEGGGEAVAAGATRWRLLIVVTGPVVRQGCLVVQVTERSWHTLRLVSVGVEVVVAVVFVVLVVVMLVMILVLMFISGCNSGTPGSFNGANCAVDGGY